MVLHLRAAFSHLHLHCNMRYQLPQGEIVSVAQQSLCNSITYQPYRATAVHSTDQSQNSTLLVKAALKSMCGTVQMDELTASNSRLVEDSTEIDNDVAHLNAHLSATRTRTLHTTTLSEQLTQELQMLQRVSCFSSDSVSLLQLLLCREQLRKWIIHSWSAGAAQSMLAALAVLADLSCSLCAAAADFSASCCFLGSARLKENQGSGLC